MSLNVKKEYSFMCTTKGSQGDEIFVSELKDSIREQLRDELEIKDITIEKIVSLDESLLCNIDNTEVLEGLDLTFNNVVELALAFKNRDKTPIFAVDSKTYSTINYVCNFGKPEPIYDELDDLLKDMTENLEAYEIAEVLKVGVFHVKFLRNKSRV
ncbi:hypothetical protein D3C81_07840 [compost metagenome]